MTTGRGRIRRESAYHADLVASYRAAREAWEAEAERQTQQYAAELTEYAAEHPAPTFHAWLSEYARAMGYRS